MPTLICVGICAVEGKSGLRGEFDLVDDPESECSFMDDRSFRIAS
jgi:hypothetical protein